MTKKTWFRSIPETDEYPWHVARIGESESLYWRPTCGDRTSYGAPSCKTCLGDSPPAGEPVCPVCARLEQAETDATELKRLRERVGRLLMDVGAMKALCPSNCARDLKDCPDDVELLEDRWCAEGIAEHYGLTDCLPKEADSGRH